MQSVKWESALPVQVICISGSNASNAATALQTDQAYYISFSRPAFIKVASEHDSLSTFYHMLNVIWTLQLIRLSAWQLLVSLHMNENYVVIPKYAAALSLSQKYSVPKRLLDYIYAHFCSPKYHLAPHVGNHIAQIAFQTDMHMSYVTYVCHKVTSAAKALPDSSQSARQQGTPVAPSMENQKPAVCLLQLARL